MKCELCHKADAEMAVRRTVNGEEQELYVCRDCAHASASRATEPPSETASSDSQPASPESLATFPLVGMILDAAFEVVGRKVSVPEPTCPVCGITRSEYRKAARLGCPACYEAFAKELDAAVFEMHRSLQHVGKTPEKARTVWRRQQLLDGLDAAVKGQRFEEAIKLRDQIRDLGGEEGGPA